MLRTSTGEGKIAFIHPDDIADVAVAALTSRAHDGDSLVITGPRALSYREMAAKLGAGVEAISDDEARPGGDSAFADALVDIWRAVREGRLATVTDEVQRVLGRAPKSFDLWVEENADAFKRSTKRRGRPARSAPPLPSRSRAK